MAAAWVLTTFVYMIHNERWVVVLTQMQALLIPSWLLSIAFTIVAVFASNEGLADRHIWDVRATQYPDVALVRLACASR
jgi:hypothetical protein